MKRVALAYVLIALAAVPLVAQKYTVTATVDKSADFAKFKTYSWENGWQAPDKSVHAEITAAVDRELAARGLEKRAAAPSDVVVTYASMRRIDVDVNAKPTTEKGGRPQFEVGTLVLLVLEPGTRKEFFRARVDRPIEADATAMNAAIDGAIAELFAKYPTRPRK